MEKRFRNKIIIIIIIKAGYQQTLRNVHLPFGVLLVKAGYQQTAKKWSPSARLVPVKAGCQQTAKKWSPSVRLVPVKAGYQQTARNGHLLFGLFLLRLAINRQREMVTFCSACSC